MRFNGPFGFSVGLVLSGAAWALYSKLDPKGCYSKFSEEKDNYEKASNLYKTGKYREAWETIQYCRLTSFDKVIYSPNVPYGSLLTYETYEEHCMWPEPDDAMKEGRLLQKTFLTVLSSGASQESEYPAYRIGARLVDAGVRHDLAGMEAAWQKHIDCESPYSLPAESRTVVKDQIERSLGEYFCPEGSCWEKMPELKRFLESQ